MIDTDVLAVIVGLLALVYIFTALAATSKPIPYVACALVAAIKVDTCVLTTVVILTLVDVFALVPIVFQLKALRASALITALIVQTSLLTTVLSSLTFIAIYNGEREPRLSKCLLFTGLCDDVVGS